MMINISEKNFEKYSRQIMMDKIGVSGQKKIMKSSICIIGCGGLGTTTAQYLAMTGVGKILLIDFDNIELSNLNRQISFLETDIGKNKAEILKKNILKINAELDVNIIKKKITKRNINLFLDKSQFIIDCSDNFETRFLINEYCFREKKILVSAALQNFDVQVSSFKAWASRKNPCYECIFPKFSNADILNCDQMGIVSPIAGFGGIMQAITVVNIILGCNNKIFRELIIFDGFTRDMKKIRIEKNLKCKICKY